MGPEGTIIGPDGSMIPADPAIVGKEIIHFKTFTLFPPSPNAPPATTRERPPGCKTIFVGGLPENATGEQLKTYCNEIRLNNSIITNLCLLKILF